MRNGRARAGFTLIELLVVIAIIAVLISVLLPTLNRAREQANCIKCASNLRTISQGLLNYIADNKGTVIPSYNLPNWSTQTVNYTAVGANQAMDGWCAILDRDGFVRSGMQDEDTRSVFYCPDTYDYYGMKNGQTATDPGKPRGYVEWPMAFDGSAGGGDSDNQIPCKIPLAGFNKIIRCSYWINAYNPIGPQTSIPNLATSDVYYTASIGWGPDANGRYILPHKASAIRHSSRLITLADGLYMGRQSSNQQGQKNSRIGYRHRGPRGANTMANVAFADGHVEAIDGLQFPQSGTSAAAMNENLNGPTVYANPEMVYGR